MSFTRSYILRSARCVCVCVFGLVRVRSLTFSVCHRQTQGLEIFLTNETSLFFAFSSVEERDRLHDLLLDQPCE